MELDDIRLGLSAADRKRLGRLFQLEVDAAGLLEGFGRGYPSATRIVPVGMLTLWRRPKRASMRIRPPRRSRPRRRGSQPHPTIDRQREADPCER